ncbi:MAG TPA: AraC family transcriptional regulator [Kofleriaceae bacterium]|jgi:AraC family transcriptional regulator
MTHLQSGRFFGSTLARRDLGDLAVTETLYPPSVVIPPHDHELASLCVVVEGAYDQRYGARERACTPGMLICHPEGERHANAHRDTSVRLLCVEIARSRLASLREAARVLDGPADFVGGDLGWLGARLTREFHRGDGLSALAIEALVLEIVVESSRSAAPAAATPPRWLARAVEYLHAHYTQTPTVGDIAAAVDIHPSHLARVFRQHEGCTVGDYLRRLRIEAARAKLAGSELPLGEIALATGFSDQSHFSRLFRAATGYTPAAYRRLARA